MTKKARKSKGPSEKSMRQVKTAAEMTPLFLKASIVQGQEALKEHPATDTMHLANAGYSIAMSIAMLTEPLVVMLEAWAKTYGAQHEDDKDEDEE